ncbi:MAG: GDYXXLXY domain-containing protein [Saprospiraceae bacterium]|nr:GDYXXLXY domain-containing protein [Candidatus Opimibacter skivensis]MBP6680429.1 GDYXXLXY domain-containing protein [Saprospiraceae bacterium]MBP8085725.1 GDYXXLXY domain-containing protein [Saprospiraceae bacterium]
MNQKITIPAFFLMVLAQLYVPASMIFQKERVIAQGTAYKFRTAPIDPNDPFRGKYITLSFNETGVKVENAEEWNNADEVYVYLTTDSSGYAMIQSIAKEQPKGRNDYIKANIDYIMTDTLSTVFVRYPFDRFYMEESKAPVAETIYNEAAIDSNQVAYALVMVMNGDAVVRDIFIDDVSITEVIRKEQNKVK